MPIDIETLTKQGKEVSGKRGQERKSSVIAVLKTKANGKLQAFTQKEVAAKLGIRPQHARSILMGLVEEKKATRKAVSDGEKTQIFYALSE